MKLSLKFARWRINAMRPDAHSRVSTAAKYLATTAIIAAALLPAGCLGLASNLMHAAGLDLIPAEYEGFEESAVALVVLTPSARHTSDPASIELNRRLREELTKGIDEIALVREDRIENWWDTHGYDSEDFAQLGKDVGADKVLIVSLDNLKLKDGATLYRGSSDTTIEVVDVATGHVVHTKRIEDYRFPQMAGQHTSETTEKRFRGLYLKMLAAEIGRAFRPFDKNERFALDGTIASQ